jgi:hypothetical protein
MRTKKRTGNSKKLATNVKANPESFYACTGLKKQKVERAVGPLVSLNDAKKSNHEETCYFYGRR